MRFNARQEGVVATRSMGDGKSATAARLRVVIKGPVGLRSLSEKRRVFKGSRLGNLVVVSALYLLCAPDKSSCERMTRVVGAVLGPSWCVK